MKAIRVHQFGGPEVMKWEDVPDPKPASGQVVVRVHATGVNPVDTYRRAGNAAPKQPLPYTPGSDASGVVESTGPGVTGVKVGDRVYTSGTASGFYDGAYAERVLCDAWQVHPLPPAVSFSQGAAMNVPYATAWRALFVKARAQKNETVLVHGASGGVGIAAVQLARAHGLNVIGTAGTDRGLALAREQGADHVLDHAQPEYLKELMALTNDRGVDVILELAAHINLGKDLPLLAKGGRVVVIGARGPVQVNPRDAMARDAVVFGMMLWNGSREEIIGIHDALVAGLADGSLKPVINQELPLQDAPRAHALVMQPGAYGKIVLIP
jgi:NADPH2:quinone reductase